MGRQAILVAHGSPGDPVPQEAAMQALAVRVGMWRPGWRIRGATLAMPGALEAALAAMDAPLIYPFFMAEGWFTKVNLPRRLAAVGCGDVRQLAPFGTDPALVDLMVAAAGGAGPVLIAAHGSKVSATSSRTTYEMVAAMIARGFGPVRAGFVEEAPFLEDLAREMGGGVCLPFFALRAGHVVGDVPEALEAAGFDGVLCPPIGEDIGVAQLIAAALERVI
ncbi:sirohydrochlorin chelatase [Pseudorhodobacter antarcticus]|nr:CbiX/SirB N-terminal domain-containing protein [Pseudorhodobacter antarcticus]